MVTLQRGDIVIMDMGFGLGSEQRGIRPCLIIQNDVGNMYSPTTIIAPLTSQKLDKEFPTDVFVSQKDSHLDKDSKILLSQILTVDKQRIKKKVCSLDYTIMKKVDLAIQISLGLE